MILVAPVERIGDEEIAHLIPSIVEDQRPPVGMRALAWVGMLVEMRAIEEAQAMLVAREVRWHPVEQHTNIMLMADSPRNT